MLDIVPESRNKVYDVRKVIEAIADKDSTFELKERYGKSLATVLARLDGKSVGFIANNPLFKGGALDADACQKVTSFMVLCDSFNIPLVFLVDVPGFLIGVEGELRGMPGKVINWMNAMTLVTVPKITVIMRKSYGQAFINMAGGSNADEVAVWPTADLGFMDPAVSVQRALRRALRGRSRALRAAQGRSRARHLRVGARRALRSADRDRSARHARLPDPHAAKCTGCA